MVACHLQRPIAEHVEDLPIAMEQLHSVVYVSSATKPVTEEALAHLLLRARSRNRAHRVTGALLFDAGNFMQYIEGPREGVASVYRHIRSDQLHTGIIELSTEQPSARIFDAWAMGARLLNPPGLTGSPLNDGAFEKQLAGLPESAGAAVGLLRGFWIRSRQQGWQ